MNYTQGEPSRVGTQGVNHENQNIKGGFYKSSFRFIQSKKKKDCITKRLEGEKIQ